MNKIAFGFVGFLFFGFFVLLTPPIALANCDTYFQTNFGDPCPGQCTTSCGVQNSNVSIVGKCNTPSLCYEEQMHCDTNAEAKAICGSGPIPTCQQGSCDNSTCASTGGCNCNDYGTYDSCVGNNPSWNSTCYWDDLGGPSNHTSGVCKGNYCCVEHPGGQGCGYYKDAKMICQGSGCHFVQGAGGCAVGSACTLPAGQTCGQTYCLDSCINTQVGPPDCPVITCTPQSSCVSNTIPTSMYSGQVQNVSVTMKNGSNATNDQVWTTSGNYRLGIWNQDVWGINRVNLPFTPVNLGQIATFNFNITAPGVGTYANQWRMLQEGVQWFGSVCGPATVTVAQPTCTVSLSTSTPTISVGSIAHIIANITTTPSTGVTVNPVTWTTTPGVPPGSVTLSSPTTVSTLIGGVWSSANNVTGASVGVINVNATVNLSPSGNCLATPLSITVLPRSWWQVTGGDVYVGGGNVVSSIPSTCTQNCYIDLAN